MTGREGSEGLESYAKEVKFRIMVLLPRWGDLIKCIEAGTQRQKNSLELSQSCTLHSIALTPNPNNEPERLSPSAVVRVALSSTVFCLVEP